MPIRPAVMPGDGTGKAALHSICVLRTSTVTYLLSRRVEKAAFVRATGVLLLPGSISLFMVFWQAGLLSGGPALFAAGMVIVALWAALLGFRPGQAVRRQLDAACFRPVVLLVLGLHLLRNVLMG